VRVDGIRLEHLQPVVREVELFKIGERLNEVGLAKLVVAEVESQKLGAILEEVRQYGLNAIVAEVDSLQLR